VAYREIPPTAALRPWVECFWTRGDDGAAGEQRVLPDGCADLVFDLTAGDGMVVGTMTKPLVLPPSGRSDFFGVRFRPGRAAAFLRIPLAEITDARVPLADVWSNWKGEPSLDALESELIRRVRPDRDRRVDAAVAQLASGARVDAVARAVGLSRQHLARQFLHHVGISPKTFARVMRFQRVIESADRHADWADVAARHGYYDQSHLIADFRDLAGATPGAFHFSNP
jgi:AraC-like DNA-binding protein